MPTIEEILVKIDANTASLRSEMARADQTVARHTGSMQRVLTQLDSRVRGVGRSVVGMAAAWASIQGMRAFMTNAREAITTLDTLGKAADRVGLAVETLQELRLGAESSGVAYDTVDTAMQRFSRRVGEAAQGTGVLLGVMAQYNIQLRDADGNLRPVEELLGDYADAIQSAGDQQERLRMAVAAFDTEGAGFALTLRNGREGLDALRDAARASGAVIDEDVVRAAEDLEDRLARLDRQMEAASQEAFVTFGEALVWIKDQAVDLVTWLSNVGTAITDLFARASGGGADGFLWGDQLEAARARRDAIETNVGVLEVLTRTPGGGRSATRQLQEARAELEALQQLDASYRIVQEQMRAGALEQELAALPSGNVGGRTGSAVDRRRIQSELEEVTAGIEEMMALRARMEALTAENEPADPPARTGSGGARGGSSRTREATDAFGDYRAEIERSVQAYQMLTAATGEGGDALAQLETRFRGLEEARRLDEQAARDGVPLSEDQRAQVLALVEAQDQAREAFDAATEAQKAQRQVAEQLGRTFSDTAQQMLDGSLSITDGIDSITNALIEMIAQAAIFDPLQEGLSGLLGGFDLGSIVGGLFGGGGVAKKFAAGGVVTSPTLAMIGEAGMAEAVIPMPSGRVPVELRGGGGGGGDIAVTVINQTSEPVTPQVSRGGVDGRQLIITLVRDDIAAGGPISRTIGHSFGLARQGY